MFVPIQIMTWMLVFPVHTVLFRLFAGLVMFDAAHPDFPPDFIFDCHNFFPKLRDLTVSRHVVGRGHMLAHVWHGSVVRVLGSHHRGSQFHLWLRMWIFLLNANSSDDFVGSETGTRSEPFPASSVLPTKEQPVAKNMAAIAPANNISDSLRH